MVPGARQAYLETLPYIAIQDPAAAEQVRRRVEHALAQLAAFPALGTPAPRRGERRFAVPKTGHVVTYRISRSALRIQAWYRARQHRFP